MVNQPNFKKSLPILFDEAVIGDAVGDPVELCEQLVVLDEMGKNLRKPDFPHHIFFIGRMLPGEFEQADQTLGELDRVRHVQQQIDPTKQLHMLCVDLRITDFERLVPLDSHVKPQFDVGANLPALALNEAGDLEPVNGWGTSC